MSFIDIGLPKSPFYKSLMGCLNEFTTTLTWQFGSHGISTHFTNSSDTIHVDVFLPKNVCHFYDVDVDDAVIQSKIATNDFYQLFNQMDKFALVRWTKKRGDDHHTFVYYFLKSGEKSSDFLLKEISFMGDVPHPITQKTSNIISNPSFTHHITLSSAVFAQNIEKLGIINVRTIMISICTTHVTLFAYDVSGVMTTVCSGYLPDWLKQLTTTTTNMTSIPVCQLSPLCIKLSARHLKTCCGIITLGPEVTLSLSSTDGLLATCSSAGGEGLIQFAIKPQKNVELPIFSSKGSFDPSFD